MKLIRFGTAGEELPGVISEDGEQLDCSTFGEDWDESFFETNGLERLSSWLKLHRDDCPTVPASTRLGPPVKRPSKLICVGLNYASHARESGMDIPDEPVIFMKSTTSITGPYDDIVVPRVLDGFGSSKTAEQTDWEVELAIVISSKCKSVSQNEAMDYVGGYVMHNDVSEREVQLNRGGQWVKGKSFDSFSPLGPWLATKSEIKDPSNLNIWLKVNGKTMQQDTTQEMIFPVAQLVSYISWHMTLLPGDIISTGTPFGVGLGLQPPRYLKPGDIIELGIEGLGIARQNVVS